MLDTRTVLLQDISLPEGGLIDKILGQTGILSAVPTDSVYISIDKDALRSPDAVTDWDQSAV